jgi:hypothetical protein
MTMVVRGRHSTFLMDYRRRLIYILIQNRPGGAQQFHNRRQAPPNDPGPSNSQDVRFIDGVTEPHYDESIPFQLGDKGEQVQWPPHTNVITYELRSLHEGVIQKGVIHEGVIQEALALAVTTRAMTGNSQAEKDVEGHKEYSSDEGPNLSDLDKVATHNKIVRR